MTPGYLIRARFEAARRSAILGRTPDGVTKVERYTATTEPYEPNGRNLRTVWTIPTEPFPEAHFATFPRRLVLSCILAGTSAKGCCAHCGAPWERAVEASGGTIGRDWRPDKSLRSTQRGSVLSTDGDKDYRRVTTGWRPTCRCPQLYEPQPCKVLDPFCGSGTVGVVATQLGRDFLGIELKPEYAEMARRRIRNPEPEPLDPVPEEQLALFRWEELHAADPDLEARTSRPPEGGPAVGSRLSALGELPLGDG